MFFDSKRSPNSPKVFHCVSIMYSLETKLGSLQVYLYPLRLLSQTLTVSRIPNTTVPEKGGKNFYLWSIYSK